MLTFSIGIGDSVSMIRAAPWQFAPGWMETSAWRCGYFNGLNPTSIPRQPIDSIHHLWRQIHTTPTGHGKQPDPSLSPYAASSR